MSAAPLSPGCTLGVLGGGQLGRMIALAAARLGVHIHVFAPEGDCPAAEVARRHTRASWDDPHALDAFAATVDVVTCEFENVPAAALERLAARVPVRPGARAFAVAQDRIAEKSFLRDLGIPTAPWRPIRAAADLGPAREALGHGILKTARLGYDGKGQLRLGAGTADAEAFAALGGVPCVLEGVVPFVRELSVLVARGPGGASVVFPLSENAHQDGVLVRARHPARAHAGAQAAAGGIARALAEGLGLVGLLCVELFLGADGRVYVNELAPRPHNSFHWTIDAGAPCQFEALVRAVLGWPLPAVVPAGDVTLENLLGDEVNGWSEALAAPGVRLHLYGKGAPRPGRKMGHLSQLLPAGTLPRGGLGDDLLSVPGEPGVHLRRGVAGWFAAGPDDAPLPAEAVPFRVRPLLAWLDAGDPRAAGWEPSHRA